MEYHCSLLKLNALRNQSSLIWHFAFRIRGRNLGSRAAFCETNPRARIMKQKWLVCVASNLPGFLDFLARFHPHIRVAVRGGGLSCLRVRLRAARRSRVYLTANVISPSPLLLLNDLAIVVSLLWHANHPRSLLRRAAERATQINFILFSITAAHLSRPIAKSFYGRLAEKKAQACSSFEKVDAQPMNIICYFLK